MSGFNMTMRLARTADGQMRHVPTPFVAAPVAKTKAKRVPPDPIKTNGDGAAERLKLLIEQLEGLHEERSEINDDIRDVEAGAKAEGYDIRGLRAILALRRMEKHVRDENEAIVETYMIALGLS